MHLAKPCALVASVQDYYNQVDVLTLLYNSSNYSDNAEKLSASKKGSDLPTIVNTPRRLLYHGGQRGCGFFQSLRQNLEKCVHLQTLCTVLPMYTWLSIKAKVSIMPDRNFLNKVS